MTDLGLTLRAARAYVARGLGVFPLNGKVPTTPNGVYDASDDDQQLIRWFEHPKNLAIAIPARVVIVDIDPRNGGDASFLAWCSEHGVDWYDLAPWVDTGGGGTHLWFCIPDGVIRFKKNPAPGIDMLTVGRYVVAPPSKTLAIYTWKRGLPEVEDGKTIADYLPVLPDWLTELAVAPAPEPIAPRTKPYNGDDELAAAARRYTSWHQLLSKHGWTQINVDGTKWRRPGSDNDVSATIKHDCLFVYSTETPFPVTESGDPHGVTLFNAIKLLDYNDDQRAMLADFRRDGFLPPLPEWVTDVSVLVAPVENPPEGENPPEVDPRDFPFVDFSNIDEDDPERKWLIEPFLADGRAHALYAKAKTGKSLLALAAAAALATGRPFLDYAGGEPMDVLYVDYEMTESDIAERLMTFGYDLKDPKLNEFLHYSLLAGVALDSREGGERIVHNAVKVGARLAVIDTTGRATVGGENEADTIRSLYTHTIGPLKRLGITTLRMDHEGKDAAQGQRGTSGKNDDVDIVWRMAHDGKDDKAERFVLEAKYARQSWVPRKVKLELTTTEPSVWSMHDMPGHGGSYPEGVGELAELLTEMGIPLDAPQKRARDELRAKGVKFSNSKLGLAFKWRSEQRHLLPVVIEP